MKCQKLTHWLCLLALLVIVAAGCGDDDDPVGYGLRADAGTDASDLDAQGEGTDGQEPDASSPPCPDGQERCNGRCVDLNTSTSHCGNCGWSCQVWDGTCVEGVCECNEADETYCRGECVDTTTDRNHCNGCGNRCDNGETHEREYCYQSECITRVERVQIETNEARSTPTDCANGVYPAAEPLRLDPFLTEAAQAHAEDMAENEFMSHTGSDGSSVGDRVDDTDYPDGGGVGENIARGYSTPTRVVQGWLSSTTGHCRNLMNSSWKAIGVGVAESDDGEMFWAQVFGAQ